MDMDMESSDFPVDENAGAVGSTSGNTGQASSQETRLVDHRGSVKSPPTPIKTANYDGRSKTAECLEAIAGAADCDEYGPFVLDALNTESYADDSQFLINVSRIMTTFDGLWTSEVRQELQTALLRTAKVLVEVVSLRHLIGIPQETILSFAAEVDHWLHKTTDMNIRHAKQFTDHLNAHADRYVSSVLKVQNDINKALAESTPVFPASASSSSRDSERERGSEMEVQEDENNQSATPSTSSGLTCANVAGASKIVTPPSSWKSTEVNCSSSSGTSSISLNSDSLAIDSSETSMVLEQQSTSCNTLTELVQELRISIDQDTSVCITCDPALNTSTASAQDESGRAAAPTTSALQTSPSTSKTVGFVHKSFLNPNSSPK